MAESVGGDMGAEVSIVDESLEEWRFIFKDLVTAPSRAYIKETAEALRRERPPIEDGPDERPPVDDDPAERHRLTAALLDRLTHHCQIFEMNGESYRFRESMKKKRTPPKDK